MLSRVANSVYWMSRYLERANNVARFIDVNLRMVLDMNFSKHDAQWDPLVRASGDENDFLGRYEYCNEETVVKFLTFDEKNPNSIISCIQKARENARTVREIISSELWESINGFFHFVKQNARKRKLIDLQSFYKTVINYGNLLTGIWADTISHGESWHFSRMGQMLERADKTARLLDVKYFILLPKSELVNSPFDSVEWAAVLKSVSAFEMYRKQYHRVNYKDVIHFLVLDPNFPRAMQFCINEAAKSLHTIATILNLNIDPQNEIHKIQNQLSNIEIDCILNTGLHEFVDEFQFNLNRLDNSIYESFFELKEQI